MTRAQRRHQAEGKPGWTWAHLAVLGAVAFVFGILVWNLAGR